MFARRKHDVAWDAPSRRAKINARHVFSARCGSRSETKQAFQSCSRLAAGTRMEIRRSGVARFVDAGAIKYVTFLYFGRSPGIPLDRPVGADTP